MNAAAVNTWMKAHYPPRPANAPTDLTRPSKGYRLRVVCAVAGLLVFFGSYVLVSGWFGWVAYHLLWQRTLERTGSLFSVLVGVAGAVIAFFLLRALVLVRVKQHLAGIEVREADEPRLFAFLRELACEMGTQPPYKVYVSPAVNAAVQTHVSLLSLVVPARRSLEIGLGLVNVLTLAELKAVLAHELGHFAQRSLLLGRWVYVMGQLARLLVMRRDHLDGLLRRLSRPVIWHPIALFVLLPVWAVRLAIWSVRTETDGTFRLLVIAQRALLRQMELQADLMAVSVSGSDPLVQALYKLPSAEISLQSAFEFSSAELGRNRRVPDVFSLQTIAREALHGIFGALFAAPPRPPPESAETHRLFTAGVGQHPRMWLTHPPAHEREANCKQRYVATSYEDAPAWSLFESAEQIRIELTREALKRSPEPVDVPPQEAAQTFRASFDRPSLNPRYRGAYLGRPTARMAEWVDDLYATAPTVERIRAELDACYPAQLGHDFAAARRLSEEEAELKAILEGRLSVADGGAAFRGTVLARRHLPGALAQVRQELAPVQARILAHDRRCRAVHRAVAAAAGGGWEQYAVGVLSILHYAEHSEANVLDARGYLGYVIQTLDHQGQISARNVPHLVSAADTVYAALTEACQQAAAVVIDPQIKARLGWDTWPLKSVSFDLPCPSPQNFGTWMQAMDRWVTFALGLFKSLRVAALDQLIVTEAALAEQYGNDTQCGRAPPASQVPCDFTRRPPGRDRERSLHRDWLERWQSAVGAWAALSRVAVASVFLLTISAIGLGIGSLTGPESENRGATARSEFQHALAILQRGHEEADYAQAAFWYDRAADHGLALAKNHLGVLYLTGQGVVRNPARGAELIRRAAEQGEREAQANLGSLYLNGTGLSRDYAQARLWLTRAAERNHPAAQAALGQLYMMGLGIPADAQTAVMWFRRGAEQGNAWAQRDLAVAYHAGRGLPQDNTKAAVWMRKAAEQGDAAAEASLGTAYLNGEGVERDPALGVNWLRKAAAQNNSLAEMNLSIAYRRGIGVERDVQEAQQWLEKAAAQGYEPAQGELQRLSAARRPKGQGARKQATDATAQ